MNMDYFKQIFLEFEESTMYKASEITSKLLEKYPDLGNEIILPINMQEDNKNIPIFVFSQNPNFQIQGNFYNVVISVNHQFIDNFNEIIEFVVETFKNNKNNFVGIACTFQEPIEKEKIHSFKKKHFINFDTIENDEVHFSMIREININEKKTRCLEGYSTLNNEFILHFEFNMKRVDFKILNINYILNFINQCINYKENKKECL